MEKLIKEDINRINELMRLTEEDNVGEYIDSTYLKTSEQAGIDEDETESIIFNTVSDAIENNFKLVMIRPEYVLMAREIIDKGKVVKWIIESAALTNDQIAELTRLISEIVIKSVGEEKARNVFVKTSTGFFKPEDGSPGGATIDAVSIMSQNAGPLQVKASGGIYSREDLDKMVDAGASRVGTSAGLEIIRGEKANIDY